MPMRKDALPQRMLTGDEVKEILKQHFAQMLDKDYAFSRAVAYRRLAVTMSVTVQMGQPKESKVIRAYTKPDDKIGLEGEVPLIPLCECGHDHTDYCSECECKEYRQATSTVVAKERDLTLDNPNLARIQNGLPIRVVETGPPPPPTVSNTLPGEPPPDMLNPFPTIETKEFRYEKGDYPGGVPPVDRDLSADTAKKIGAKTRR